MSLLDDLKVNAWKEKAWKKLFQGDALFTEIKALPPDELPQNIRQIETCQQTMRNPLPGDLWAVARAVLSCAEIAALDQYAYRNLPDLLSKIDPSYSSSTHSTQPAISLDEQSWQPGLRAALKQVAWPIPASPAWAWDTINGFWKKQRRVTSQQRITLLLLDEKSQGLTANLTLEVITDGEGELYPDPECMSFVSLKEAYLQSLEAAIALARQRGLWPTQQDIRWRVERQDGEQISALDGGSAGGAYALGLLRLLADAD